MTDVRCREAVEASERYADGLILEEALDLLSAAAEEAFEDSRGLESNIPYAASYSSSPSLSINVLEDAINGIPDIAPCGWREELKAQAVLIRDIFGNPFRPVAADPAWLTSTVVALAAQMYDSRDFSAMPILADALQDAGCDNADVLNHCRSEVLHVRGCWVVDLVLGKA